MDRLLDNDMLERSSVVANRDMNRERALNGYVRELGVDVLDLVTERLAHGPVRWLDLCCGTGTALLECAARVNDPALHITGVDLVDFYAGPPHPRVELTTGSVTTYTPPHPVDLVTSVHGLHYVGDKLAILTRGASWLTPDGILVANLDLTAVLSDQGHPLRRRLTGPLRAAGFTYDTRRHRITCTGPRDVRLPFRYLGADDQAGPNYTGQPAVNSYYADAP